MLEAGSGSLHDSLTTKANKEQATMHSKIKKKKGQTEFMTKTKRCINLRDDNKMETGVMIGNGKHKVGEELERESAAMASTRMKT